MTGKIKSFVGRLEKELPNCTFLHIPYKGDTVVDEPYVLITYTFGHGDKPKEVVRFMDRCGDNIVAVVGSGERNWGRERYCRASIDIAIEYGVPLLHNFEKKGFDSDVRIVADKIREIEERMK